MHTLKISPPVKIIYAVFMRFYSHPTLFFLSFLKMAYLSNICLDLSLGNDVGAPHQGDIWRPSFLFSNGPLTVEDFVMRDATTATVVARNLLTHRDNRLLSRRSDELAIQDFLAFSVQCAGSVSNMGQRSTRSNSPSRIIDDRGGKLLDERSDGSSARIESYACACK